MAPRTSSTGITGAAAHATSATASGRPSGESTGVGASPEHLSVDIDSLRALASTLADQSASVDAIESAARITAVGNTLAGTAVGAALARAAAPLAGAHRQLSGALSAMADTARSNAADFEAAEDDFREKLRAVSGDGR